MHTHHSLSFRSASLADLDLIIKIYNQTIASRMVTADIAPITVADRLAWFQQHDPIRRPLWIIQQKEVACGWISLSTFYGRAAYNKTVEISLYIDEKYRGQQIGPAAIQAIEQHAKQHGIENIVSYVFGHNMPSLKLFIDKMGYQQWGVLPNVAELDQVKRDLVILGKTLATEICS